MSKHYSPEGQRAESKIVGRLMVILAAAVAVVSLLTLASPASASTAPASRTVTVTDGCRSAQGDTQEFTVNYHQNSRTHAVYINWIGGASRKGVIFRVGYSSDGIGGIQHYSSNKAYYDGRSYNVFASSHFAVYSPTGGNVELLFKVIWPHTWTPDHWCSGFQTLV